MRLSRVAAVLVLAAALGCATAKTADAPTSALVTTPAAAAPDAAPTATAVAPTGADAPAGTQTATSKYTYHSPPSPPLYLSSYEQTFTGARIEEVDEDHGHPYGDAARADV